MPTSWRRRGFIHWYKNNFESGNSATFGLKGVGEIFRHFFPMFGENSFFLYKAL